MRAIDVLECAAFGRSPRVALRLGYVASTLRWTGCVDGRPELMFGVSPMPTMDGSARPWMLGSDVARQRARPFIELSGAVLAEIDARYRRLENHAHQTNTVAHRWLKRLGFTVGDEIVMIGGEPFVRFWRQTGV